MSSKRLKQIAISQDNYFLLKKLGNAGDSFNDVVSKLLKKELQSDSQIPPRNQIAKSDIKPQEVV
jgi:predicted CopG family antitoxin